ncbi:MAG: hypothetical protein A2W85_10530 [Bacteroidetes bacterium GWF2_41_31]|nr:MAG: hypothetical protein A2W85_10530 [Bacteroidetes bacterium GWF2_41_31]OFZ04247.1 MAG: hypothetical protein A2338_07315 [Bacteroidetes bacterium RIFOXYB12_FULL_41_6]
MIQVLMALTPENAINEVPRLTLTLGGGLGLSSASPTDITLLPNPVDWALVVATGSNRQDKTIAANKRIFTNLLQKYTSCGYGGINCMDFLGSHKFIGK